MRGLGLPDEPSISVTNQRQVLTFSEGYFAVLQSSLASMLSCNG